MSAKIQKQSGKSRPAAAASPQVTFSVDPSMYDWAHRSDFRDIYAHLGSIVRTDLRYHYAGPICACRWISLCNDPSYGHRRLVSMIGSALPDLSRAMQKDSGRLSVVDLVSLGPGTGAIDLRILRSLQAHSLLGCYCCLDSSFELLRYTVNRIANHKALRNTPVRAICGDFTRVRSFNSYSTRKDSTRLFTLTGFTLGNFREAGLLSSIRRGMSGRDYLLLDARLHDLFGWNGRRQLNDRERQSVARSYRPRRVRQFVFGPVEVATFASFSDVRIGYDVAGNRSDVPGAVRIVIYCTGLDTRMRLTGKPIHRERLDLASTTLYRYADLAEWLKHYGFHLVWQNAVGAVGLFLLRRSH